MYLARVIGSVWSTCKHAPLERGRFVILQPLDEEGAEAGAPLVALDTAGSGPGEIVLYTTAYEAVIPWKELHPEIEVAGVDASVVAILDRLDVAEERT